MEINYMIRVSDLGNFVFFVLSAFFLIISIFFVQNAYAATLTCAFTGGICTNTTVLYAQNDSGGFFNAHAQNVSNFTFSRYNNKLCCYSDLSLGYSCSNGAVLKLSNQTNAHVQTGNYTGPGAVYSTNICLSADNSNLSCVYEKNAGSSSCVSSEYTCFASIASSENSAGNVTNAHIGPCNEYDMKVCCKIPAITSCTTITTAGTYTQGANIIPTTGASCINITATGVTFDGAGYSIYNATYTGYGVYTSRDNTTIQNGNITVGNTTSAYGIYLWGANDSKVLNNTIQGRYGIYLLTASRNNLTGNFINASASLASNYGIYLNTRADNNTISANVIRSGGSAGSNHGIYLITTVFNNNISNNIINTSGTSINNGIRLESTTSNNTIYSNTIYTSGTAGNNWGIYFTSSSSANNVSNNIINTSGTSANYGVVSDSSSNFNIINSNTIRVGGSGSANQGIYINNIGYTIINNYINTSGTINNYGIYLNSAKNNNVSNNIINTSGTSTNYGIYLTSNANNNTITANNIRSGGSTTDNYGIYLLNTVIGNNITNNYINTSGTTSNYGIYLQTSVFNNNVSNNIINTSGTSTNYGIYLNSNANNNTITANNIRTGGSVNNNYGVYLFSTVIGNNITHNYINTSGTTTNYGISLSTDATNNNVSNNYINTSGTSGNTGIYLQTASNNTITANNIQTGGSSSDNYGIILYFTLSGNNITHNYINTSGTTINYGIYLLANAFNNNISFNNIRTSGKTGAAQHGIYLSASSNNTFESNIINNSNGSAIYLETNFAGNNNFTNNSIISPAGWFLDFQVATGGINGTWLIDQVIRNYSFAGAGGIVNFLNTTNGAMGQIQFLQQINGSGEMLFGNASAAIRILNNSAFVNDTIGGTGLNRAANVTLFGIGVMGNPIIAKNGIECTYTSGCYNFTSLEGGTVSFNVTGWSNYSILNKTNQAPINPSIAMNSSDGSNRTMQDLWCYANLLDPDADNRLNVTVSWYNSSVLVLSADYNNSYANNTAFNASLDNKNTTKYENWTCGMRTFDGSAYSAWTNTSIGVNITNTLPNVTLIGPVNGVATTNRTTMFNWSASDDDNDGMMIELRINSMNYTANNAGCSENITRNFTSATTSFIPSNHLKCLYDSGFYYNWSVRANDTTGDYGSWGTLTNRASIVNITAVVDISLNISSISFENQSFFFNPSNQTNQSTHSPDPFIIQNDGNALINISLSSSNLWLTFANPSQYYRFKVNNNSWENGSFDWLRSTTAFTNMPFADTDFLVDLNYTNESQDSAAIDIYVEAPDDEPAGARNATVTFISRLTE